MRYGPLSSASAHGARSSPRARSRKTPTASGAARPKSPISILGAVASSAPAMRSSSATTSVTSASTARAARGGGASAETATAAERNSARDGARAQATRDGCSAVPVASRSIAIKIEGIILGRAGIKTFLGPGGKFGQVRLPVEQGPARTRASRSARADTARPDRRGRTPRVQIGEGEQRVKMNGSSADDDERARRPSVKPASARSTG